MPRYIVYSDQVRIGITHLEHGDPPMGVAFGEFHPEPEYAAIREFCQANHSDQSELGLSVTTELGERIECLAVGVLDYADQPPPHYVEVNVIGVPHELYARLFPEHVLAYENRFKAQPRPAGDA